MTKIATVVGYGETVEKSPGVWDDVITEKRYFGDVLVPGRRVQDGADINKDLTPMNSISIVADAYASTHFFAIRYVKWSGVLWTVLNVQVQGPRLQLRLGGVYNGPTAPAP